MKRCLQAAIIATAVCTIGVSSAVAETKKPQKISTPKEAGALLRRIGDGRFREGSFELALHGFGRVKIHLTELNRDLLPGDSSTNLFKGTIERIGRQRSNSKKRWTAGSVFEQDGKLLFELYFPLQTRAGKQHYLKLEGAVPERGETGTARIRRMPAVAKKAIDESAISTYVGSEPVEPDFSIQHATTARTLELAVEGEGVTTQSTASILNAVDSIYQEQLGIKLAIKSQQALSSSHYSQTSPEGLLNEFREESTSVTADMHLLLTSKRFAGGTAGVAFSGVVCRAPRYSYGLATTTYGAATPYITAHEIAHTLGADHHEGIMSAVMSNDDTSFSQESRSQIGAYLQQNGGCLGTTGEQPVLPKQTPIATPPPRTPTPVGTPRPQVTPTPRPSATPSPMIPTIKGDILSNKLSIEVGKEAACDIGLFGGVGSAGQFKAAGTLAVRKTTDRVVKFSADLDSRPSDAEAIAIFAVTNCNGIRSTSKPLVIDTSKISSSEYEAPFAWVQKLQQRLNGTGKTSPVATPRPNVTATPKAPGAPIAQENLAASAEKVVHDLINQHRASKGLATFKLDARVSGIARGHSLNMANGSVPPGHAGFNERVEQIKGMMPLQQAAENVAWFPTAEAAVQAWLSSPGHRSNIEGSFTTTGVGVVKGELGLYFTQLFIR